MSKPPFIASQKISRLALTEGQRRRAHEYLRGARIVEMGGMHAPGEDDESRWEIVQRATYLAELGHPKLCLTVDGGIGKSIALWQTQVLRQQLLPGHVAIRFDLADLPQSYEQYLDRPENDEVTPCLVTHLRRQFQKSIKDTSGQRRAIGRCPSAADLTGWLRDLIRRGRFTLLVDALDQIALDKGEVRTRALAAFLDVYSNAHCVVAGRRYAIQDDYWHLFSDGTEAGSQWEFARVEPFERETEVPQYVGQTRYRILKQLGASELFVPRTLEIVRTLESRRKIRQWDYDQFCGKLEELAAINSQFIDFAFLGARDIKDLRWRNVTLRDFFAALWMVRASSHEQRQWLHQRQTVRNAYQDTTREETSRHVAYYDLWRFVCQMPFDALTSGGPNEPAERRYVDTVAGLFQRGAFSRPNELIYRCWPRLLQYAGFPLANPMSEKSIQAATAVAQDAAWELAPDDPLGENSAAEPNVAQRLILNWLAEYPRILLAESDSNQGVAQRFEAGFRRIPKQGQELSFWYGDDPQEARIENVFWLSAYTVTNQLVKLYDPHHYAMFDPVKNTGLSESEIEYAKSSPYGDGPAIYLKWYDAWCLSVWFHGRLPSELEWEFACRSRPGARENVPHYTWHFGDEKAQLKHYAWYWDNAADSNEGQSYARHAHPVGKKPPNDFGLHDMHGNVWEWCADWYDEAHGFRVLRGGSFGVIADDSRCSYRDFIVPSNASVNYGCRVARAQIRKS